MYVYQREKGDNIVPSTWIGTRNTFIRDLHRILLRRNCSIKNKTNSLSSAKIRRPKMERQATLHARSIFENIIILLYYRKGDRSLSTVMILNELDFWNECCHVLNWRRNGIVRGGGDGASAKTKPAGNWSYSSPNSFITLV